MPWKMRTTAAGPDGVFLADHVYEDVPDEFKASGAAVREGAAPKPPKPPETATAAPQESAALEPPQPRRPQGRRTTGPPPAPPKPAEE